MSAKLRSNPAGSYQELSGRLQFEAGPLQRMLERQVVAEPRLSIPPPLHSLRARFSVDTGRSMYPTMLLGVPSPSHRQWSHVFRQAHSTIVPRSMHKERFAISHSQEHNQRVDMLSYPDLGGRGQYRFTWSWSHRCQHRLRQNNAHARFSKFLSCTLVCGRATFCRIAIS